MPYEAVNYLNCKPGNVYVDCTLGGAGHAQKILEKIMPDGILIGIDADIEAIKNAENILAPYSKNVILINDNFTNILNVLYKLNIEKVDGIIADLGLSLNQIKKSGRGFSFNKDEDLDMRFNQLDKVKAYDFVNKSSKDELNKIFKEFGEERYAKAIARRIIKKRADYPIKSSLMLAEIIRSVVLRKQKKREKIDPATRVFMALRIAVNNEFEALNKLLSDSLFLLKSGARMSIISFHSLEHKIIKRKIKEMEKECICPSNFPQCVCDGKKEVRIITKKPIRASEYEVEKNSMARSAQLRVFERI
jgi:16S rRNA (cytosine1402-N4)-methyltransferase